MNIMTLLTDGADGQEKRRQYALSAFVMLFVIVLITVVANQLAGFTVMRKLGIGALPLSIVLGMGLATLSWVEGLRRFTGAANMQNFSQKWLLQTGIVLFGFQLSLTDLTAVGWQAVVADMTTIVVVLPLGIWLGHQWLKLPLSLAVLLAIGSAVCGAAAILATVPVLSRYLNDGESEQQQDQSAGLAVAAVAFFGTVSVLLYPQAQLWFQLTDSAAGIYIGSTIHEVAQALAASDALGQATQHNAVIVKLMRVVMLAPVLIVLALWLQETGNSDDSNVNISRHKITVPGFVLLFLLIVVVNSFLPVFVAEPLMATIRTVSGFISTVALALAMAALGLNIRWRTLAHSGWKPLILGAVLWCVLMIGGGLFSYWLNIGTPL